MPTTGQAEYTYDLFISYADADRAWVEGYLLDALTRAGVRCHSEAAFALGVPRVLEFERAVQQSQRILLVLSPATLAEGFGQFTDLLAQSYGLEAATWPVIPLILHPVKLPPRLAMLTALDATDSATRPAVVERLCAELERPVPGPAPRPPCPYPGMVPFSEADRDRFFGRDEEVQELLERLRLHPFLTVIGPSGSGKSSLVFAGLVPALRKSGLFGPGGWLVRTLRPGVSPLAALAAALDGDPSTGSGQAPANLDQAVSELLRTARSDDFSRPGPAATKVATTNNRLLLVVDQFEELFTLARSDVEPFQRALVRLAKTPNCYVALTVRADFYPDLMACPLWLEIQAHRSEVLPLDEDGLRQAIVRPAEDVGVFVETALVERLVADAAGEPGILPLVQETLVLLWEKVERRYLPLRAYDALVLSARDYRELGGVPLTGLQVAMARRADATLAGLTPEQQAIARRIFLRLVQFGQGRADTRRQQPVAALRVAGGEPEAFDRTLEHLTRNRLLTLSGEEGGDGRRVDIAHESLITGWPALQEWLTERREAELTRRRLEGKAAEWVRLGRVGGGLLDEIELLEAERWLDSPDGADLGYGEALPTLVQASRAAIEEVEREKEAARQRELAQAQALAEEQKRRAEAERQRAEEQTRASRRLRVLAGVLTVVFLLAAGAAVFAVRKQREAAQQARLARSGQLAAQAQVVLEEHPQRSLLLALEALHVTVWENGPRTPIAEQALREALANTGGLGLSGHEDAIWAMAISPDNRWLVTGSLDNTARLWDLAAQDPTAQPIVLTGHEDAIWAVAISPDNRWLVTGSRDDTARLWDLTAQDPTTQPIVLTGHEDRINAVTFSPDSHWLVTGSDDTTARLWDLTAQDPSTHPIVLTGHEAAIMAVAISPDNRWLVTGSWDNTVRLWDLTAQDPSVQPIVLTGHEGGISAVAISPDNQWLVTGSYDDTARLWDLTAQDPTAQPIALTGHEARISAVAISPDSHWLVTGSDDTTARLWDLRAQDPSAQPILLAGHKHWITVVAISPDNHWLVTGSWDNTARLWDLTAQDPSAQPIVLNGHEDPIMAVAISPDNHWLVTGSQDDTARLWDLRAQVPVAQPIVLTGHEDYITSVAISPDNHWLVTGSDDDTARLWDLTVQDPAAQPIVLTGHEASIMALAISPDSHWLVTGGLDETARLWDLTAQDPAAQPIVLTGHEGDISDVAISPDSHWLVTGSYDSTARLWDLTAQDPSAQPIVLTGHEGAIWAVAISLDNRWLVTGSFDDTARLWDLTAEDPSAQPIVLTGHEASIMALAISPDSHWLVTGSDDTTARLWDLTAQDPAAQPIVLAGHEDTIWAVAFSPDSHWLVTGSWDDARLWDLTAQDPTAQPIVLTGRGDGITDVAISADNHWLVGSGAYTAYLWDLAAQDPSAQPIVLLGHEDGIRAMAISSDSHWLVTGSQDTTARLWNLRVDELIDLACRTAGRNLTQAEWEQYFPGQDHRRTCEQWPLEEE